MVWSRGRPRHVSAVTENRTRELHARDIKDYNGRSLITGAGGLAVPREPSRSPVVEHSSWGIPLLRENRSPGSVREEWSGVERSSSTEKGGGDGEREFIVRVAGI